MYPKILTHWSRDKMGAISQTTFSNAFSSMKIYEFRLRFHWSLFLRFILTISQHWFRYWLVADQATSHYLNQWWLIYWHICVTQPQWVNLPDLQNFRLLKTDYIEIWSKFSPSHLRMVEKIVQWACSLKDHCFVIYKLCKTLFISEAQKYIQVYKI